MHKFFALYINEMIKISRKIVVIIILAIMFAGVIMFGSLMKVQQINTERQAGTPLTSDMQKDEMKNQLDYFKAELKNIEDRIKNAATEEEKAVFEIDKAYMLQQVELYQMAVDYGINLNNGGYKATLLNEIFNLKKQLKEIDAVPIDKRTIEQTAQYTALKQFIVKYTAILDTSDFKKFIELKNDEIDQTAGLSDDEKKLKKETNLLWLKLDPKGEAGTKNNIYIMQATLSQIENLKRSLLYNVDYSSQTQYVKPLTPAARQKVEDDLAVLLYKAEHDMIDTENTAGMEFQQIAISGMFGFGLFMIVCMMLILAGGAVSQEISSGSIKSLIISPAKRYKIFFAKLLSLLTVGIISAIFLYIIAMLTHGILFGFASGSPYIFVLNGNVVPMNFYIHRLAILSVNFIDVIVYSIFAYMLSIITRNTAASVGISIGIYFGGSLANTFISIFAKGEWVKFIPFSNLSLAAKIFPDPMANIQNALTGGLRTFTSSTTFSLIYLVVMSGCFIYIALDSFNRRDIK